MGRMAMDRNTRSSHLFSKIAVPLISAQSRDAKLLVFNGSELKSAILLKSEFDPCNAQKRFCNGKQFLHCGGGFLQLGAEVLQGGNRFLQAFGPLL